MNISGSLSIDFLLKAFFSRFFIESFKAAKKNNSNNFFFTFVKLHYTERYKSFNNQNAFENLKYVSFKGKENLKSPF